MADVGTATIRVEADTSPFEASISKLRVGFSYHLRLALQVAELILLGIIAIKL